jgi:uncharacterized protein YjbI with pentapeptide repeats
MDRSYVEDKKFEKINFTEKPLALADYEGCSFVNCNFSDSNLSQMHFSDCEFRNCNLTATNLNGAVLHGVKFFDCKLMGVHFETCNVVLFVVSFEGCILNLSSFYQLKVKNTVFKKCILNETDFTGADLSNAVFDHCDMANAIFENTVLEKADLRTSFNYSIDPDINRIKKAKFSLPGVIALLAKYDIVID